MIDDFTPVRAFADGGMDSLLYGALTNDYCPVDVGLPSLNKLLGNLNSYDGIGLGNLVVLGGAPGSMKTTVALYWMRRAAQTSGVRPVFITYEMGIMHLRLRLAQGYFDVPRHDFVPKKLTPERLVELDLHYKHNPPDFDPEFIRLYNRDLDFFLRGLEHLRSMGYNWFIFDNIQKLSVEGIRDTDYAAKVEAIMFALEAFVMRDINHPVTIVGLSQINREASNNRYEAPSKHSLLGGTGIESQATLCLLLDHTRQAYDDQFNCTRSFILVEKNRDGPQFKEVMFEMDWSKMRIREGFPDEERLWPARAKKKDL